MHRQNLKTTKTATSILRNGRHGNKKMNEPCECVKLFRQSPLLAKVLLKGSSLVLPQINFPTRHDSGSTSCFGNKAKSRRYRRSMRLSKPAPAFENRVSYPITDKDKGKENVTGQRLANHNCSLAADSSANSK